MISFVIPTLNEEKHLEETLKNISEYLGEYEIIVSDGGSTDKTFEIARKYTPHVLTHTKPHRQTIAEGRNIGGFKAKGTYIVEIDADTRFPDINHFFKIMIARFEKDPKIVGATTWFRVYLKDEKVMDRFMYGFMGSISLILNNYFQLSATIGGEFQMMRAETFRKIGGYNKKIVVTEDNEIFIRLRKFGKIHFENNLRIYHSGRRAHHIGWPKLITQGIGNMISLALFKRSASKEWTPIR